MLDSLNTEKNNKKLFDFIKKHYDLADKSFYNIWKSLKSLEDNVFIKIKLSLEEQEFFDYNYNQYYIGLLNYKDFRDKKNNPNGSQFPSNKRDLYLIITNDPSQMMFQSTGYTWTNCCTYGNYLSNGLPQSLLNKSRAVCFITDGKIKKYEEIEYYNCITYSDALLSFDFKKDIIISKKAYPFNFISENRIYEIEKMFRDNKKYLLNIFFSERTENKGSLNLEKFEFNKDENLYYRYNKKIRAAIDIAVIYNKGEENKFKNDLIEGAKFTLRNRITDKIDSTNILHKVDYKTKRFILKEIKE